jgi:hypothetical protein
LFRQKGSDRRMHAVQCAELNRSATRHTAHSGCRLGSSDERRGAGQIARKRSNTFGGRGASQAV